jgi:hypothetical protein
MDILGVDLAYVKVDGRGAREGDDPGGGGQEVEDVTEDVAGKAGIFLSSLSWAE